MSQSMAWHASLRLHLMLPWITQALKEWEANEAVRQAELAKVVGEAPDGTAAPPSLPRML